MATTTTRTMFHAGKLAVQPRADLEGRSQGRPLQSADTRRVRQLEHMRSSATTARILVTLVLQGGDPRAHRCRNARRLGRARRTHRLASGPTNGTRSSKVAASVMTPS